MIEVEGYIPPRSIYVLHPKFREAHADEPDILAGLERMIEKGQAIVSPELPVGEEQPKKAEEPAS